METKKEQDEIMEEIRIELKFSNIKISYINEETEILIEYLKTNREFILSVASILNLFIVEGFTKDEVIYIIKDYSNHIDRENE